MSAYIIRYSFAKKLMKAICHPFTMDESLCKVEKYIDKVNREKRKKLLVVNPPLVKCSEHKQTRPFLTILQNLLASNPNIPDQGYPIIFKILPERFETIEIIGHSVNILVFIFMPFGFLCGYYQWTSFQMLLTACIYFLMEFMNGNVKCTSYKFYQPCLSYIIGILTGYLIIFSLYIMDLLCGYTLISDGMFSHLLPLTFGILLGYTIVCERYIKD